MSKRIEYIIDEILDQYAYADESTRPWIIGFSGGKDSTVLLMLVWIALEKLKEAVGAQGGDISYIDDTSKFIDASVCIEYKAEKSGYINKIDAQKIGRASVLLGAGREKKDDVIY